MCFNSGNNDCSCLWIVLIIILLCCCCGGSGNSNHCCCHHDHHCGCGDECGSGCC